MGSRKRRKAVRNKELQAKKGELPERRTACKITREIMKAY
jgi:hypothetical protein